MEGTEGVVVPLSRESIVEQARQELPHSTHNTPSTYPPLPPSESSTDNEGEVGNVSLVGSESFETEEGGLAPIESSFASTNDAPRTSSSLFVPPTPASPTSRIALEVEGSGALMEIGTLEEEKKVGEPEGERRDASEAISAGVVEEEMNENPLGIRDSADGETKEASPSVNPSSASNPISELLSALFNSSTFSPAAEEYDIGYEASSGESMDTGTFSGTSDSGIDRGDVGLQNMGPTHLKDGSGSTASEFVDAVEARAVVEEDETTNYGSSLNVASITAFSVLLSNADRTSSSTFSDDQDGKIEPPGVGPLTGVEESAESGLKEKKEEEAVGDEASDLDLSVKVEGGREVDRKLDGAEEIKMGERSINTEDGNVEEQLVGAKLSLSAEEFSPQKKRDLLDTEPPASNPLKVLSPSTPDFTPSSLPPLLFGTAAIDSISFDVPLTESVDTSSFSIDGQLSTPIWQPAVSNPVRLVRTVSSPSALPLSLHSLEISTSSESVDSVSSSDATDASIVGNDVNSLKLAEKMSGGIDTSFEGISRAQFPTSTTTEETLRTESASKRKFSPPAEGECSDDEDTKKFETRKDSPIITSTEELQKGMSLFTLALAQIPPFEPRKTTPIVPKLSSTSEFSKGPGRVRDTGMEFVLRSKQGLAEGRLVANSVIFQPRSVAQQNVPVSTNSGSKSSQSVSISAAEPKLVENLEAAPRNPYAPYQDPSTFRPIYLPESHALLNSSSSFMPAAVSHAHALWQHSLQSFNPQLVQQAAIQPAFSPVNQMPPNSLAMVSAPLRSTPSARSLPVGSTAITIRKPYSSEDMETILRSLELETFFTPQELVSRPDLAKKISQLAQGKTRIERENTILKVRIDASAGLQRENDRLQEMLRQANEEDWSGSSGREAMASEIEELKEEMAVISSDRDKAYDKVEKQRTTIIDLTKDVKDYEKDVDEYEKDAQNFEKDVENYETEIKIYKERANLHIVALSKSAEVARNSESTIESQRKELEKHSNSLHVAQERQERFSELESLGRHSKTEVKELKESVSFLKLKIRGLSSEKEAYERKSNRLEGEVAIANDLLKVARGKVETLRSHERVVPSGAVSPGFARVNENEEEKESLTKLLDESQAIIDVFAMRLAASEKRNEILAARVEMYQGSASKAVKENFTLSKPSEVESEGKDESSVLSPKA